MSIALAFWVLMLVWLVFSLYNGWPLTKASGGMFLEFVLFALLGWAVFGSAIHK